MNKNNKKSNKNIKFLKLLNQEIFNHYFLKIIFISENVDKLVMILNYNKNIINKEEKVKSILNNKYKSKMDQHKISKNDYLISLFFY
jgi:hypothetical protein